MASKKTKTTAAVAPVAPAAPAAYQSPNTAPAAYVAGTYNSEYADKLNSALDKVTNWSYDPMKDASYQALAKVYGARGNIAAKNSLADAAALNGGYGTSYAVSAAQQARNQYNQELAALIPDLENTAYNRATGTLSALRDADNTAYGRFRDTESDRQWKYTQDYQAYRDKESDSQWAWSNEYNKYRDLMGDYQWAQDFAFQQKQYNDSKKGSSGGGGGRRSSGGRSGGYTATGGGMPITREEFNNLGKTGNESNSKPKTTKASSKKSTTQYRNIKGDFVRNETTKKIKKK